ncbi:unnamed protein product [Psylliodes chrysocephalus]|uniref:Uncharacterized protein n=1 Tax=Psylliodes chrysocephalus TaxID=3402493 RepID=A0A9P0CE17_9CUCU|nr:unnamed protein product [Psylliodes chrysocephala]
MAGLKITFLIIGAFLLAAQVNSKAVNDEGQVGKINFKEDNIIDQVAEIVNFLKSKTILGQELIEHILLKAGDVIKVITYNYDGFQNKVVDHARNKTTQSLERVNKVLNEVNKRDDCLCKRLKCFQKTTTKERQVNQLNSTTQQNVYLCGLISCKTIQQRRPRKSEDTALLYDKSYSYHVKINRDADILEIPVCYKAFLSIHGITKKKMEYLQKSLKATGTYPTELRESSAEVQKYIGCVTSQESDVADIAANLVLNFTTCTKNALSLLAIDLTPLVKVLSSTSKKMKAIADDLDNSCPGTSVFTLACLGQKLYEIFSVFNKDLPLIVVRSTSVLIVDLPFLQNSAAKCMKSSVPDVLAEFGKVVNSIASCNK